MKEFHVRVTKDVHDAIKDMAAKESRSMNMQVVHILKETVEAWKHQEKKK